LEPHGRRRILLAVVSGELEGEEPLQATVWMCIEHARVTECPLVPLSELSEFGQSEQTRALDEHTTKGQQFSCSLKLLKFLRYFRFFCASKRAFDYFSILAAF